MSELTPEELMQEARRSLTAPARQGWRGVTESDLDRAARDVATGLRAKGVRPGAAAGATSSGQPSRRRRAAELSEDIAPRSATVPVLRVVKGGASD